MDLPVRTVVNQTLSYIIGSRNEFSAWRFVQSRRRSGVPRGVINAVLRNIKFRYDLKYIDPSSLLSYCPVSRKCGIVYIDKFTWVSDWQDILELELFVACVRCQILSVPIGYQNLE